MDAGLVDEKLGLTDLGKEYLADEDAFGRTWKTEIVNLLYSASESFRRGYDLFRADDAPYKR